jgi:uncharacterized membrane protein (DUF485 family)
MLDTSRRPETDVAGVTRDPLFRELVKTRTRFAWTLSGIILAVYLGFILLVAFARDFMATKIAGTTSLGIVLGFAVIVFAFVLTGVYINRANGRFDDLTRQLKERFSK